MNKRPRPEIGRYGKGRNDMDGRSVETKRERKSKNIHSEAET
jgi:hypothetical protein